MSRSLDWGLIDSGLYNECSTGRARASQTCRHCLSDFHLEQQCPLATATPELPPPGVPGGGQAVTQSMPREPNPAR